MTESSKPRWAVVRREAGPGLKLFRARFDHMLNPRNGKTERMVILESEDSANVVALTSGKEMAFVRQYRFGIADYTLELPGGIVDAGEGHADAARRELEEETGYTGGSWSYLGRIASNPVFMDSYIHHWLALDVTLGSSQQLDDGEEVEVINLPLEEVRSMLLQGRFQHPHTVNALLLFFNQTHPSWL